MKKVIPFFVLFLFLKLSAAFGQDEMFKALFMYNFTKNIEWPTEYKQGDFIIGVLGNSPIIDELDKIAARKTVGNQKIVIKRYATLDEVNQCHILFIPTTKSNVLADAVAKCNSNATLIITDKPGLVHSGAALNFVKVDGKQKFEISTANIEKSDLKVNAYLVSLGIEVN